MNSHPCGGNRNTETGTAYTLECARAGQDVAVVEVAGGLGLRRRLEDMGLVPGTLLRVQSMGHPGPLVICVKGSRLILGHGMAHHIRVRPVEEQEA